MFIPERWIIKDDINLICNIVCQMSRKKTSPVWGHVEEDLVDGKMVRKCLHCEGIIPWVRNTTNIINHFKNYHKEAYKEIELRIKRKRKKTVTSNKNKGLLDDSLSSGSESDGDIQEYNSSLNDLNTISIVRYCQ